MSAGTAGWGADGRWASFLFGMLFALGHEICLMTREGAICYTMHAMDALSRLTSEISVLREIASVVARERNVRKLLEEVIVILERSMGMLRGNFTLL